MNFVRTVSLFVLVAALAACGGRRGGGGGGNPDLGRSPDGATGDGSTPPGDGGGIDLGHIDGSLPDFGLPDLSHPDGSSGFCGDFSIGAGEQCDQGGVDTSECDYDCTFSMCGDFHVNSSAGEECDDGPSGSSTCSVDCTSITPGFCGDGIIQAGEACDDGGSFSGDGCSSSCTVESGWSCSGTPSFCTMSTTPGTVNIHSGSNSISGSLSTSDPTWTRPGSGCTTGSTVVHYKTYTLHNSGATTLTLTITATWPGDGFLAVYSSPFTPTSGTTGCLASNDDYTSTGSSQVTGVTLPAGGNIVLVVTEYSSGAVAGVGSYSIAIDAV